MRGFTDGGYAFTAELEGGVWGFSCDDFPGANSMGSTFKEARESLEEIVVGLIAIYREEGNPYPQPTEPSLLRAA
jgi:predicted RNase H-like HicB family nuclease